MSSFKSPLDTLPASESLEDIRSHASDMDSLHELNPYDNSADPVAGRLFGTYRNWRIGRAMKRNVETGTILEGLKPHLDRRTYLVFAERLGEIHILANDRAVNRMPRFFYVYYRYPKTVDYTSVQVLRDITYHVSVTKGKRNRDDKAVGTITAPTGSSRSEGESEFKLPMQNGSKLCIQPDLVLCIQPETDLELPQTDGRASPLSIDTSYSDFYPVSYGPPLYTPPKDTSDRPQPWAAGSKLFEWSVDRFKRDRPTVDTKAADDTLLPHPGTTAAPSVIASPVDDSARPEPSTSQSKLLDWSVDLDHLTRVPERANSRVMDSILPFLLPPGVTLTPRNGQPAASK